MVSSDHKQLAQWYLARKRHWPVAIVMPVVIIWAAYVLLVNLNRQIAISNIQLDRAELKASLPPPIPDRENAYACLKQASELTVPWDAKKYFADAGWTVTSTPEQTKSGEYSSQDRSEQVVVARKPDSSEPTSPSSYPSSYELPRFVIDVGRKKSNSPVRLYLQDNSSFLAALKIAASRAKFHNTDYYDENRRYSLTTAPILSVALTQANQYAIDDEWNECIELYAQVVNVDNLVMNDNRYWSFESSQSMSREIALSMLDLFWRHPPGDKTISDKLLCCLRQLPVEVDMNTANKREMLQGLLKYDQEQMRDSCPYWWNSRYNANYSRYGNRWPAWLSPELLFYPTSRSALIEEKTQRDSFPGLKAASPSLFCSLMSLTGVPGDLREVNHLYHRLDKHDIAELRSNMFLAVKGIQCLNFHRTHGRWPDTLSAMKEMVRAEPSDKISLITNEENSLILCYGREPKQPLLDMYARYTRPGYSKHSWGQILCLPKPKTTEQTQRGFTDEE